MNKNKNGLLDENGNYKPVDNKYKYKSLTKEKIEEYLKELTADLKEDKPKLEIWAFGYEDENGKIRCGFLEEFDKAMKESLLNNKLNDSNSREDRDTNT